MVMRDIALCRLTGARVHFSQLSTPHAIAMVSSARAEGLPVSVDVSPNHLALNDEACTTFDARYKVSPPLRNGAAVAGLRDAATAGSVDAIATGHRPWPAHEKDQPFDHAPAGIIGFETALAVVQNAVGLDLGAAVAIMSTAPAQIAGISKRHGQLPVTGGPANLMIFDPNETWTVPADGGASLSRNTPFAGQTFTGKVRHTIVNGELVVRDGEATR